MAFINSRSFVGNYAAKEIDLSFKKCGCSTPVKLQQTWELELLDCKPVCIIKTIPLTTALFWNLLFAPCSRHTIKLASKQELKMRDIASEVVKKRINAVWINRTNYQLDQLFQNNPEWLIRMTIIYAQPDAKAGGKWCSPVASARYLPLFSAASADTDVSAGDTNGMSAFCASSSCFFKWYPPFASTYCSLLSPIVSAGADASVISTSLSYFLRWYPPVMSTRCLLLSPIACASANTSTSSAGDVSAICASSSWFLRW